MVSTCASIIVVGQAFAVTSFPNGLIWDWQIGGNSVNASRNVDVIDIDLFNNSAADIQTIQNSGKLVIC